MAPRLALALTLAFLAAVRPAAAVQVDFLPKPDPDDGKTFRVLCFHDIRDNLRASFETLPDGFAVDTKMLTNMFSWIQANGYHPVTLAQIDAARHGGKPLPKRPILLTLMTAMKATTRRSSRCSSSSAFRRCSAW